MRSRVMPGSLVTMERRVPVKRLKSVDLPTLGRPTMTSDGNFCDILFGIETLARLPLKRGVAAGARRSFESWKVVSFEFWETETPDPWGFLGKDVILWELC